MKPKPELEAFSKRLKALINALGVEQQAFAEVGGIKPPTLTAYLQAKTQPSQDVLSKWVSNYEVDANWFLTGEGPMFREERKNLPPALPTPVTDALRETELAMRRVGASDQSVWAAVHGLARDRMGQASEPDTETAKRVGNDKNG